MRLTYIGLVTSIGLFILPFLPRLSLINGAVSTKALFVIFLVDLLLLMAVLPSLRKGALSLRTGMFGASLIVFASTLLLSALTGVNGMHSLLGDMARSAGIIFILHILALAFVLGHITTHNDWSVIRRSIVYSACLLSTLTLIGTGALGYAGSILWIDFGSLGVTLGNDTFLGMYLVLAALIGCIEFVRSSSVKNRASIAVALVLIAVSPTLLGIQGLVSGVPPTSVIDFAGSARASSAAFLLFSTFIFGWWILTMVPHRFMRRLTKFIWASIFVVSFIVGSVTIITPGSSLQQSLGDETMVARLITWEAALPAFGDRVLLGWGHGNFNQAFEQRFDTRLYEHAGINEVWFDKAHNVYLNTAIEGGVVGLLAGAFLLAGYLVVVVRSRKRNIIGEAEAVILCALPLVHLTQLQTAFDTVTTYVLLGVIASYVLSLEREVGKEGRLLSRYKHMHLVVIGMALLSLGYYFGYESPRQVSLSASLSESNAQKRTELVDFALSRTSDFEGLHRTSIEFTETVFRKLESESNDEAVVEQARPYLSQYVVAYERYIQKNPTHYRARVNYAYLLLLQAKWGGDSAQTALHIIEDSYQHSPRNPLTYVLHIIALGHLGDLPGAEAKLKELKELAPNIELTKDTERWLNTQKEIAPKNTFLRIGNI